MKKSIIISIFLLFVASVTFAQVTDSTATVTYTFGDSLSAFFSKNMWTLAFAAFFILSEWLGQTEKVKEGSVWAMILNWIGKFIKSKTTFVQSKKAKFMNDVQIKTARGLKILVIGMFLTCIGLTASAQGGWKITKEDFKMPQAQAVSLNKSVYSFGANADTVYVKNKVFIRTAANAAITNLTYDKDLKKWNSEFLSLVGYGATIQWYTIESNKVIETWGLTGLVMTNTGAFIGETATKLYFGLIGSYRGLLTIGTNIDIKTGKLGIMPGVQLTF